MEFFSQENLTRFYCMLIVGETGTGKTALGFRILEELKEKQIYFINHPKPQLIEPLGYENLTQFDDVLRIKDSVIVWDEFQLSFSGLSQYKREVATIHLLSMLRQKGNQLIMTTSDTRAVSPRIEAYINLWLIKQCDYRMTKQRSKVRQIIEANSFIPCLSSLSLNDSEFIADSSRFRDVNGKHSFTVGKVWNEKLSTPYK